MYTIEINYNDIVALDVMTNKIKSPGIILMVFMLICTIYYDFTNFVMFIFGYFEKNILSLMTAKYTGHL